MAEPKLQLEQKVEDLEKAVENQVVRSARIEQAISFLADRGYFGQADRQKVEHILYGTEDSDTAANSTHNRVLEG
jgi:hypothetical protein